MEPVWSPYGARMEPVWSPYGARMEPVGGGSLSFVPLRSTRGTDVFQREAHVVPKEESASVVVYPLSLSEGSARGEASSRKRLRFNFFLKEA